MARGEGEGIVALSLVQNRHEVRVARRSGLDLDTGRLCRTGGHESLVVRT